MDTILWNQLWLMAAAMACGLLIALFYDIYWLLTAYRRPTLWLRVLQDILFWVATFCLIASLWLYYAGGAIRLYIYLWLGLGIILFRRLCSPVLRRLLAARKHPRKTYSLPPRLYYAAARPQAAMFKVGCFIMKIKILRPDKIAARCQSMGEFLRGATPKILRPDKLAARCQGAGKFLRRAAKKFFGSNK